MSLTPKQKVFAKAYATNNNNAKQAALIAGYAERSASSYGHDLLKIPEVQAFIEQVRISAAGNSEVNFEWCLTQLKKVVIKSFSPDGNHTGNLPLNTAVNAISEINKMLGHYAPQKIMAAGIIAEVEGEELLELFKSYEKEY